MGKNIFRNFKNNLYELIGYSSGNIGAFKKVISEHLDCSKSSSTLDFGCGTGMFCDLFDQGNYLGVDVNRERIDFAIKKHKGYKFQTLKSMSDFSSCQFDNILCLGVFHHMDDQSINQIMLQFNKVLKREGKILAIEPTLTGSMLRDRLIKYLDRGAFVRSKEQYTLLMTKMFSVQVSTVRPPIASRIWSSDFVYSLDKLL